MRYSPLLFLGFLAGCVTVAPKPSLFPPTPPVVNRYTAVIRLAPDRMPSITDDLDSASLKAAALQSAAYYDSLPKDQLYVLGQDTYTVRELSDSMKAVALLLDSSESWKDRMGKEFAWYQSVGTDAEHSVIFSSYYEPRIAARLAPDKQFQFPLYARPPDMVDVDLGLFNPDLQGSRVVGRRQGRALVPYLTRAEIDSKKSLQGQGLELAWAKDPFEVLDLQIEGSGWLDIGQGELRRIRYDGDNGWKYRSVGQYTIASGRIPAKRFSRRELKRYLATHPKERQNVLNVNDRYIFFRIDTSTASPYAFGNIHVPLTPGRSMATDPALFPKGLLGWVDTQCAVVDPKDKVLGSKPFRRFMVNQDEGGAIKGPGRVDIFAGHGTDAEHFATHQWYSGKLYFLVKRKD